MKLSLLKPEGTQRVGIPNVRWRWVRWGRSEEYGREELKT